MRLHRLLPVPPHQRLRIAISGVLVIVLVSFLDLMTGPILSLSLLYILPIVLVTWAVGWQAGLVLAIASALVSLAAVLLGEAPTPAWVEPLLPVWNTLMRFGVFALLVFLVAILQQSLQREQARASHDTLTGALNHGAFVEALQRAVTGARRYHHPLSLVYLDIDNFKTINDRLGHLAGDRVLQDTVALLRSALRPSDIVGRLGGDEFAVVLSETDATGAQAVGQRLHRALTAIAPSEVATITLSVGVVTYLRPPAHVNQVLAAADELMYAVKRDGKNGVQYIVCSDDAKP